MAKRAATTYGKVYAKERGKKRGRKRAKKAKASYGKVPYGSKP